VNDSNRAAAAFEALTDAKLRGLRRELTPFAKRCLDGANRGVGREITVGGEKLAEGSTRRWSDPESVVDEAIVRALAGRRKWTGRHSLGAWLKGVIRSIVSEGVPRRKRTLQGNPLTLLRRKGVSSGALIRLRVLSRHGASARPNRSQRRKAVSRDSGLSERRLKQYPALLRKQAVELRRLLGVLFES
jgi:DNA-directed RNA polymerase specialized sigma24 family protein